VEGAKNLACCNTTTGSRRQEGIIPTALVSIPTLLALLADLEELPRTGRVITSPLYPNTTPNVANLHPPASDKPVPFSKRLRDFLHDSLFGADMC
jgi:hypothetical protein